MALITLRNINISFDKPLILEDLSLDIHKGQRICILGRNGAGKSTLMKIISGELKPDSGEISVSPGLRISHLSQSVPDTLEGSVFDVVAAGAGPAGKALAAYHKELSGPADTDLLHKLQHDITILDGWNIDACIERVLDQVQVAPDLPFASLSGGLRRRVFLAQALVQEPDILLLDEPTNHLDLESIAWLEDFLLSSRLTVLFVTHDRRLLKRLATRIVEIDRGKIIDWSCDYPTFLVRKQAVLDNEEKAWELFDKKLAQEEIWIRKGVKARRTRCEGRVTALLKMREERRKRRERAGQVSLSISAGARSGDRVLEAKNISFGYGQKPLIQDFSFSLTRGDRVGIIGPNGCGKTTLLNLLLGKTAPRTGSVELGSQVSPLYFDQLREGIDPEKTIWENLAPEGNDTVFVNDKPRHIVSYLQDFLFTSERARTRVKLLSGGERHRLLLARLFMSPSNLLIFDEPTNDLDTETLELLEEVLLEYKGTLLVVSHDREFLNNVVTSALIFGKDSTLNEYIGGYDDWERQAAQDTPPSAPGPAVKKEKPAKNTSTVPKTVRKISPKEKKELLEFPAKIEALDAEKQEIHVQLADFKLCQKPGFVMKAKARLTEIEAELVKTYARWEELEALP
jgi:ABC transport system ATP-binding/permease protein